MRVLPPDPTDDELLAVVREWVAALAAGDFRRAYELTAHDPYYGWSPTLIRDVIAGYGSPELTRDGVEHRVTPIESAVGGPRPRHEVDRWESPRDLGDGRLAIGQVWFDLPLDGEWSDLTATFEIRQADDGVRLVLNDIHVF